MEISRNKVFQGWRGGTGSRRRDPELLPANEQGKRIGFRIRHRSS